MEPGTIVELVKKGQTQVNLDRIAAKNNEIK